MDEARCKLEFERCLRNSRNGHGSWHAQLMQSSIECDSPDSVLAHIAAAVDRLEAEATSLAEAAAAVAVAEVAAAAVAAAQWEAAR